MDYTEVPRQQQQRTAFGTLAIQWPVADFAVRNHAGEATNVTVNTVPSRLQDETLTQLDYPSTVVMDATRECANLRQNQMALRFN